MDAGALNISEALVSYLGVGVKPVPDRYVDLLIDRYGQQRSEEFRPILDGLLDEAMSVHVDWDENDLAGGGDIAEAYMRKAHPELTVEAAKAIRRYFTWNWR